MRGATDPGELAQTSMKGGKIIPERLPRRPETWVGGGNMKSRRTISPEKAEKRSFEAEKRRLRGEHILSRPTSVYREGREDLLGKKKIWPFIR